MVRKKSSKRPKKSSKRPKKSSKRPKKSPVGYKISKLKKEGYGHRQAVAIALSMRDRGELGPRGGYVRRKPARKKLIKH